MSLSLPPQYANCEDICIPYSVIDTLLTNSEFPKVWGRWRLQDGTRSKLQQSVWRIQRLLPSHWLTTTAPLS